MLVNYKKLGDREIEIGRLRIEIARITEEIEFRLKEILAANHSKQVLEEAEAF